MRDGSGSADRKNGNYFLKEGATVFQDDSQDAIAQSGGMDWIFSDSNQDLLATLLNPIFAGDLSFLR